MLASMVACEVDIIASGEELLLCLDMVLFAIKITQVNSLYYVFRLSLKIIVFLNLHLILLY